MEAGGTGWTDRLRKNIDGAAEEWDAGAQDDDPTWEQLGDVYKLQWVRGYVASYDIAKEKYRKPKQRATRC
jgi:hypothetical protein